MPGSSDIKPRDEYRGLAVLVAIALIPKPTCRDVVEVTGIPRRSVIDIINRLSAFETDIARIDSKRYGYYSLRDQGVYNVDRATTIISKQFPAVYRKINQLAAKRDSEIFC